MSTMGPEMPTHCWYVPVWNPPSCSSTMIVCTPRRRSSRAARFAVSTSSLNWMPRIPAWATRVGVASNVMPM